MSTIDVLPSDLAAAHAMIREQDILLREQLLLQQEQDAINQGLANELEKAKFEIEQLKRYIYGRRSERYTSSDLQLPLFDQGQDNEQAPEQTTAPEAEVATQSVTYQRAKRSKSDRFPPNLPREIKTIDVPESDRKCACCGEEMPIIDTDIRERLEFVPAKLIVHETHYPKRACGTCKGAVTLASPPAADQDGASLTPGSRYGIGVTAQIILGKYADHLPLYRLEDVFARAGVVIPRSTQVDLLAAAADVIAPLTELMAQRLRCSGVLGLDDTPVRLQDPALPGKMRTARMWLARGSEATPYNVFFFHESRERDGPAKFLQDYQGWVSVDAYGVNDGVYLGSAGRIMASCCHAHVRRKFEAAKGNDPARAARALAYYRQLFDIEDRIAEFSAAERLEVRQHETLPLLERFKAWLDEQRSNPGVLPKSLIGVAVRYAVNQWQSLLAVTLDGRLPLDNNATERDLRRLTIGRKNWLFIGSHSAGEVAARMYTLVASASRHNLDVWAYLDDVLRKLSGSEAEIAKALPSLLPDVWATSHPESIRTYREHESLARAAKTKARRALRRKQIKS